MRISPLKALAVAVVVLLTAGLSAAAENGVVTVVWRGPRRRIV